MSFPSPTPRQAQILWNAITALAIAISLLLIGLLAWGAGWMINRLSSVILPLAIAGVIAYLFDPVVDLLEKRKVPRTRAILLVFFLTFMLVLILAATVVPQLIGQTNQLINEFPAQAEKFKLVVSGWLERSGWGMRAKEAWDTQYGDKAKVWLTDAFPIVSQWLLTQLTRVASWAGFLAGLVLIPVYAFYFLLEKSGIEKNWSDYLPLKESKVKEEVVFVIRSINDHLIVFFRGQVLVAMCVGLLLTIGFTAIGLKYALVLGVIAGILGIVPYLGVMISIVPAVLLAVVQFGDWLHPLLVVCTFILVQMAEGLFISPKIIGDRVGLHPLTIIVAVMIGTTLMGGILGGVLAIPLTAALRVLMFRYVWRKRSKQK